MVQSTVPDIASILYSEKESLLKHQQEHNCLLTKKLFFDPFNLSPAISLKVSFGKNKKKFIFHSNPQFVPKNGKSVLIPLSGSTAEIIIGRMKDEKNCIGIEDDTSISREFHGKFVCVDEIIYYFANPKKDNTSCLMMKKEKAYPIRNIEIIEIENYALLIQNLTKESFSAPFIQKKVNGEEVSKKIGEDLKFVFEEGNNALYFRKKDFSFLSGIEFKCIAEIHLKFWRKGDNIFVEDASDLNYTTYIQIKNGENFALSDDDVLRLGASPLKFCINIKPYQPYLTNKRIIKF